MKVKSVHLFLGTLLLLAGCRDFGCSKKVLSEAQSPNGGLQATIVEVDCGATTDFASHVLLHRPKDDFRDGELLFVVKGQPAISATWKNDNTLVINCNCSEKSIFRQVTKIGDTNIQYTFSASTGPGIG